MQTENTQMALHQTKSGEWYVWFAATILPKTSLILVGGSPYTYIRKCMVVCLNALAKVKCVVKLTN